MSDLPKAVRIKEVGPREGFQFEKGAISLEDKISLVDDPHLNASNQLLETPLPGRGTAKLPKMPVRSTAYEFALRRPAPSLGEHTREVLLELGLTKDEIDALASRRVIG